MSRSKWKYVIATKDINQARTNLITPNFFNKKLKVYNGKQFKELLVVSDNIGHKFGEFIFTKSIAKYKQHDK